MTDNAQKLNYLIAKYDFPLCVLQDIRLRVGDCTASYTDKGIIEQYIGQQVRYLENILKVQGIEVNYKYMEVI